MKTEGLSRGKKRILLVMPIYNESNSLDEIFYILEQKWSFDILAIDDGSTDESLDFIYERNSGVTLSNQRNQGYGSALKKGIKYALQEQFDYLLSFDGDLQHDACFLRSFLDLAGKADIISGSRYLKDSPRISDAPRFRVMGNEFYREMFRKFTGLELTDVWCGMRLYNVSSLSHLKLSSDGYAFPLEFWIEAQMNGLNFIEVPVPMIYFQKDFERDQSPDRLKKAGFEFFKTFVMSLLKAFHLEYSYLEDYALELLNLDVFDFNKKEKGMIEWVITEVKAQYSL